MTDEPDKSARNWMAAAEPPLEDSLREPRPEWLAEMAETLRALLTADPDWPKTG